MFKFSMDIITALEKITSFTYFLSLISLALFVDLYLIHNYNIVIWQVDIEWLKAHAITIDISAFVIWFVLFYIFAVPLLHRIVIFILTMTYLSIPVNLRYPSSSINRPYHIHINILRDFAIQHNNASAYKLYEETRDKHRVSKTAILGPNSLTGFWIQDVKAVSLMPGGPALSGK